MTVEAEFGRLISQHAVKLTGMLIVTRLAVALLDRFMLRCVRNVLMTGQTEPLIKGLYFNRGAFNEVTVVAVAISYRRVDYLPEQSRIAGTMLCVAVDTPGYNRVTLMVRNELGAAEFMAGTTKLIAGFFQQS